ncbi:MAG TPA: DUF4235 domain-containing protein [Acidimicrobiales bacterium]|nr:DUF4235 domain-containing protein [Acidimicrobiales bacterium]
MIKLLYKPLGIVTGVLGGLAAGAIFKGIWRLLAHEEEPPEATRADRSWAEVLVAAALEGAVYALVKAALERAGAVGFEKATGTWPGETEGS